MGKSARRKEARRRTEFVVRVGYCDGSEEYNGFASLADAQRMVDGVRCMLDEPEGVDLLEIVDFRSGAVEFRAVREVSHGLA